MAAGNHKYHPKPDIKEITGFLDLQQVPSKTFVQRGGVLRLRWKDSKGNIYEWDFKSGALEKYTRQGQHLGEFDYKNGEQIKSANKNRRIEP